MTLSALATWHELVRTRNTKDLGPLLADDVVFYSPIVHAPQAGKTITLKYLTAALQVFADDSFRYVRELAGPRDAALEFQVEIEGTSVNGMDVIKWDDEGRIVEFKVFIRPLKAINLIHQRMAEMLTTNR